MFKAVDNSHDVRLPRGDGMHSSTVCDSDRNSSAPEKTDQKEDANMANNK